MAVASRAELAKRLTEQLAGDRNDLAASLANKIAIAHASAGGQLSEQCTRWRAQGLAITLVGEISREAS